MYARIMTFQHHQPENVEKGIQFVHDVVLPELKQEEGFQEFLLLVDRSTHRLVSITLHQTQEHLQTTGAHISNPTLQRRVSQFGSPFAASPVVETYEVALQG